MSYKIAVIQRFLPSRSRGGVGYFTHGFCNALVESGHRVTVFTQHPRPKNALYEVRIVPEERPEQKWDSILFPFQIARVDFSGFDLIHAQGDEQWVKRYQAPPVVRTLHGSAWDTAIHSGLKFGSLKLFLLHFYFYFWEIVAVLRADRVAAISKGAAVHCPRVHVYIPNGIELADFQNVKEKKSNHPVVLFVGEMKTRKRGWLVQKVFEEDILPEIPEAELWVVGPDKPEGKGIRSFGVLPNEELIKLYHQAWLFCMPSSCEGFGRPYVEAMAAGTPVVTTSNAGAKEILRDGKDGVMVPDAELGKSVLRLLQDETLRDLYRSRGLKRVREYAWSSIVKQYEKVYAAVLKKNA